MDFVNWCGMWAAAIILWIALPTLWIYWLVKTGPRRRYRGTLSHRLRPGGF